MKSGSVLVSVSGILGTRREEIFHKPRIYSKTIILILFPTFLSPQQSKCFGANNRYKIISSGISRGVLLFLCNAQFLISMVHGALMFAV